MTIDGIEASLYAMPPSTQDDPLLGYKVGTPIREAQREADSTVSNNRGTASPGHEIDNLPVGQVDQQEEVSNPRRQAEAIHMGRLVEYENNILPDPRSGGSSGASSRIIEVEFSGVATPVVRSGNTPELRDGGNTLGDGIGILVSNLAQARRALDRNRENDGMDINRGPPSDREVAQIRNNQVDGADRQGYMGQACARDPRTNAETRREVPSEIARIGRGALQLDLGIDMGRQTLEQGRWTRHSEALQLNPSPRQYEARHAGPSTSGFFIREPPNTSSRVEYRPRTPPNIGVGMNPSRVETARPLSSPLSISRLGNLHSLDGYTTPPRSIPTPRVTSSNPPSSQIPQVVFRSTDGEGSGTSHKARMGMNADTPETGMAGNGTKNTCEETPIQNEEGFEELISPDGLEVDIVTPTTIERRAEVGSSGSISSPLVVSGGQNKIEGSRQGGFNHVKFEENSRRGGGNERESEVGEGSGRGSGGWKAGLGRVFGRGGRGGVRDRVRQIENPGSR